MSNYSFYSKYLKNNDDRYDDHDDDDDRYDDHDNDDTILVGGVTYTETADDVYVSANGDTIVEEPVTQLKSYDDDMLLEAVSAISPTTFDPNTLVVRFETDKQLNTVGVGVDYDDFYSVVYHIVGTNTLTGNSAVAADVDGNGSIDILDAVGILQMISGSKDTNAFALVGADDVTTAEIVMIGDVNNSLQYVDLVA